jgi:hypothetical protein
MTSILVELLCVGLALKMGVQLHVGNILRPTGCYQNPRIEVWLNSDKPTPALLIVALGKKAPLPSCFVAIF